MKAALLVSLVIAFSACISSAPEDREEAPASPDLGGVAPGCDPTRPAIFHRAGELIEANANAAIPCTSYIGTPSFEPNVGVAADGTVFMYPAARLGLPSPVAVARSTDQGATWKIITPDIAGQPAHPYSQDPYMFVDPSTDRLFVEDLLLVPPTCGAMSFSNNKGDTWTHTQSGCGVTDHVTIFSGKPTTSRMLNEYPNVIYRCAISGGALAGTSTAVACQRSIDGGMTWLPPGQPAFVFPPGSAAQANGCWGGNGHGATNAKGRVFLPRGHCGQPWLAISDDEAMSWKTVQVAKNGMACGSLCEHDAGVGEDPNGTVYYSWVAADRQAYLSRSRDGGATWDAAQKIGLPGLNETSMLQMHVGGTGKIAIVYYGSTTSPGAPWRNADYADTYWNAYLSMSWDADAPTPTFQTVMLNDPEDPLIRGTCGPLRCQEVYDYIDIRIGPDGTPWVPLVDGCFDDCELSNTQSKGLVGRAWGAASLWNDSDPNGHFAGGLIS